MSPQVMDMVLFAFMFYFCLSRFCRAQISEVDFVSHFFLFMEGDLEYCYIPIMMKVVKTDCKILLKILQFLSQIA